MNSGGDKVIRVGYNPLEDDIQVDDNRKAEWSRGVMPTTSV